MTVATLQTSLIGIQREIHRRDQQLRQLARWYGRSRRKHAKPSKAGYTLHFFYTQGPKAMREMNVLKSICEDIEKIIAKRLEETSW